MIVERLNILISLIFPVTVIVSVNYPKLLIVKNNITRVKTSIDVRGQTDTFLIDTGGERLAAG